MRNAPSDNISTHGAAACDAPPLPDRDLRRNYFAHVADGGLFMGGLALVNANTLLPPIVKGLDGPDWLVSLMPVMLWVGIMLPPMLTAHRVDRLHLTKPVLALTGIFQRLPYLVAAIALLAAGSGRPVLVLAAVGLAPLASGIFCGVTVAAWQILLVRTVRPNRFPSMHALRYLTSCVLGLAAGVAVKAVLAAWPGPTGYGVLHMATFGMLVLSYVSFLMVREGPPPAEAPLAGGPPPGLLENLRAAAALVRRDRRLALFVAARSATNGIFIMVPFMAIHAQKLLGKPEAWLGDVLIVQMAGAIAGNLAAGAIGDRRGGKAVTLLAQVVFLGVAAATLAARTDLAWKAVFFAFGFAFYALQVGASALALELCPARGRGTFMAVITFASLPSLLAATGTSALVWNRTGRFDLIAWATLACVAASVVLLAVMPNPRKARG
jgi:hypothetical protein